MTLLVSPPPVILVASLDVCLILISTDLSPPALCTLASLNPCLTRLRLDFCGRMDDMVASAWTSALPHLKRIELFGPFLVRAPAWLTFFKGHPNLEGFLITQSPRFDLECMRALIETSPQLRELRLNEVGKMADTFLECIKALKGSLTSLSLAYPEKPLALSERAVEDLLSAVGGSLTHLDLSGNQNLTDGFLYQGVKPHMHALNYLALADIPDLTNKGVAEFFNTWAQQNNPPKTPEEESSAASLSNDRPDRLTYLNMSRNKDLAGEALFALLEHSGHSLEYLNINGWKDASEEALRAIASHAKNLKRLDVGWCREMHDGVALDLLENCSDIEELKVWGCQLLTTKCPRKVRGFCHSTGLCSQTVFCICREVSMSTVSRYRIYFDRS